MFFTVLLMGCVNIPERITHREVELINGAKIHCESLDPITDYKHNMSAYDCDGEQIFPIVNVVSIKKVKADD